MAARDGEAIRGGDVFFVLRRRISDGPLFGEGRQLGAAVCSDASTAGRGDKAAGTLPAAEAEHSCLRGNQEVV